MSPRTCPKCGDLCHPNAVTCPDCGAALVNGHPAPANRERSFCRYCGSMTRYRDRVCAKHRDLIPLDPAFEDR